MGCRMKGYPAACCSWARARVFAASIALKARVSSVRSSKENASKSACPLFFVSLLPHFTAQALKSPAMATGLRFFASTTSRSKSSCNTRPHVTAAEMHSAYLDSHECSLGSSMTSWTGCLPQAQIAAEAVASNFQVNPSKFLYWSAIMITSTTQSVQLLVLVSRSCAASQWLRLICRIFSVIFGDKLSTPSRTLGNLCS